MSDENYLLTPDCAGPLVKRAALDRLLAQERQRTIKECAEIAGPSECYPDCKSPVCATRAWVAHSILFLLNKGDTK